jgi:predicted nucleic acid-binding Zn ribbon protein
VAEINTPQSMDVAGVYLLYDKSIAHLYLACPPKENLIMNIEKHNTKMFNIFIMVVLAAILVTVIGGFIMQRQIMPSRENGMGMGRSSNPMQPESAQSGPTGTLVMSTGIILLLVGFGVLIVILLAKRNSLHSNSS